MEMYQIDFAKGKISRCILDVGMSMTLAQVLNLLYNIVDRIYIGRIRGYGSLALAGVGLCFPIITLITAFAMLYGLAGGAPLFSMQRGKGDREEAAKTMGMAFSMLLMTGIAIVIIGLLFFEPILYFFGASDVTYQYAQQYGVIYLLGSPFVLISLGMNPFINSQGSGKIGMATVLIGAILNIILDPIFIFGFSMGVSGAAIATVISQVAAALFAVIFLSRKHREIPLKWKYMKVKWQRLKEIVVLGFSDFMMGCTSSLIQMVCNRLVSGYGGDLYVGVITILNSVREIFLVPLQGIANGSIPVIAFNYGGKNFSRVQEGVRFTLKCCVIFSVFMWAVVYFFPDILIRIFNQEAKVVAAGSSALKIYFWGYIMIALQITGQSIFLALGKAKKVTLFSFLQKMILIIPLMIFLPYMIAPAVNGILWAEPISNAVGGIFYFLIMKAMLAKEIKK